MSGASFLKARERNEGCNMKMKQFVVSICQNKKSGMILSCANGEVMVA